jgi:hypothetical protein
MSLDTLVDMTVEEIANLVKGNKMIGKAIKNAVHQFPNLDIDVKIQPLTRTVLKVQLSIHSIPFHSIHNFLILSFFVLFLSIL